jgi:hypothetical protein
MSIKVLMEPLRLTVQPVWMIVWMLALTILAMLWNTVKNMAATDIPQRM